MHQDNELLSDSYFLIQLSILTGKIETLARGNRVYLQESLTAACYVKYLISQTDVLLVLL